MLRPPSSVVRAGMVLSWLVTLKELGVDGRAVANYVGVPGAVEILAHTCHATQQGGEVQPFPLEGQVQTKEVFGCRGTFDFSVVIVDDFEKKEQIAECSIGLGMNKFTHQCPVIVAVVLEKQNFMSTIGSMIKNKDYSLFDLGIAVNQFCLQAADLGLGTCIIGWFDEKKIKKILGVRNRRIPLLISVGYPDAPTRDKVRKPLEMMSSWNEY